MCVRAARDRAEMSWQIGPRISSATGCYPYSSTGLRGSTVYFHDAFLQWIQLPCKAVNGQSCGLNFML